MQWDVSESGKTLEVSQNSEVWLIIIKMLTSKLELMSESDLKNYVHELHGNYTIQKQMNEDLTSKIIEVNERQT